MAKQADTWLAHTTAAIARLDRATRQACRWAGHATPTARRPSAQERQQTDRDQIVPTRQDRGRPSGPTNPTLSTVISQEAAAQAALTDLYGCVTFASDLAYTMGVTVPPPPPEPPTRTTMSGRTVVSVGLPEAARHHTACIRWLSETVRLVAERMHAADPVALAGRLELASQLTRTVDMTAARWGVTVPPRLCATRGCDRPSPPGRGATCVACRKRRSRQVVA